MENHLEFDFKDLFDLLRKRPGMLFSVNQELLSTYIGFFEGFLIGIGIENRVNMERELSNWYQGQVETRASNMYWFAQFQMVNNMKTEKEKVAELINNIEEFFREWNSQKNSKEI